MTPYIHSYEFAKQCAIAKSVAENVEFLLSERTNLTLDDSTLEEIYDFLVCHKLGNNHIKVIFTSQPISYVNSTLSVDDCHEVVLSIDKNQLPNSYYSYLLSVTVQKKANVMFKSFWKNRHCPDKLLPSVLNLLDCTSPITIIMCQDLDLWIKLCKQYDDTLFIRAPINVEDFDYSNQSGFVSLKSNTVVMINKNISKQLVCYIFKNRK